MLESLDRMDYIYEGLHQLQDTTYYRLLEKPTFMETKGLITDIFNTLQKKKILTKKVNCLKGEDTPR